MRTICYIYIHPTRINTIQKHLFVLSRSQYKRNISFSFISRTFLCIIIILAAKAGATHKNGLVHSVVASSGGVAASLLAMCQTYRLYIWCPMRPCQLYKFKVKNMCINRIYILYIHEETIVKTKESVNIKIKNRVPFD